VRGRRHRLSAVAADRRQELGLWARDARTAGYSTIDGAQLWDVPDSIGRAVGTHSMTTTGHSAQNSRPVSEIPRRGRTRWHRRQVSDLSLPEFDVAKAGITNAQLVVTRGCPTTIAD
jgi:hypothetical protein